MNTSIGMVDWAIIALYLAAVMGLGVAAGFLRRKGERGDELHLLSGVPDWWLEAGREIRVEKALTHFGPLSLRVRGTAKGVEVKFDPPRRAPPTRVVLHLPKSRPLSKSVRGVEVASRPDDTKRWDFPTVVELYRR